MRAKSRQASITGKRTTPQGYGLCVLARNCHVSPSPCVMVRLRRIRHYVAETARTGDRLGGSGISGLGKQRGKKPAARRIADTDALGHGAKGLDQAGRLR